MRNEKNERKYFRDVYKLDKFFLEFHLSPFLLLPFELVTIVLVD
jgi:hypothetical protein